MFGIPKDFDFLMFAGKTLESVTFVPYSVHLLFEDNLRLTIESSYEHQMSTGYSTGVIEIPTETSTLMSMIGKSVKRATAEGSGTLVLHFEKGHVLKCFDDSEQYESYTITQNGKETRV